jgi:exopolysaccharide biosynthesis polyprenyl glycosylphosphotransferase
MLKRQARLIAAGLRTVDLAILVAALPIAYLIRDRMAGGTVPGLMPFARYWSLLALSLLLWIGAARLSRVYDVYRTRSIVTEIFRIGRAIATLAILVSAASFLARQRELSRLLVGIYYGAAFVLLAVSRLAIRGTAHALRRRGYNTRTFAIVGTGELAVSLREGILSHRTWGYAFAGYVLDGDAPARTSGPVLGHAADLPAILERHVIDLLVFAVVPSRMIDLEVAVAAAEEQGVPVRIALDLFPERRSELSIEEVDGVPVLSIPSGPHDLLPLFAKRVLDVVGSALALLVLSPLLATIALLVKLESPGPALFRQVRVGLMGRRFTLYKFRSMRNGAEDELHRLLSRNEADGPVFKMRDDPRVTRVGAFLRRTSLDEFPQLWNVLVGEMSLVGPRPPLPQEVQRYQRWQRRRLSVKPGLTCTWQVSGRSDMTFDRWMELDLEYIDRWSLRNDLRILMRTIPAVLLGRGAR